MSKTHMECQLFLNLDTEEILEHLLDKRYNHLYVLNFKPDYSRNWVKGTIVIPDGLNLVNITIRDLSFDLKTNLIDLKKLIEIYGFMDIYQFNKPISDNLLIKIIPDESKEKILRQNGLEHIIEIDKEDTIVRSFDKGYIDGLRQNNILSKKLFHQ